MECDLKNPATRWTLLCGVLFLAVSFGYPAGKAGLADHWSRTADPELWRKAAELEPGNENYWIRLGVYDQENLLHADELRALQEFQRAAKVNPRSAEAWLRIAQARENLGDTEGARGAYDKAQACYPISARVAWRYGSFQIRRNQMVLALEQMRRAIRGDPSLTLSAISQSWQAGAGAGALLDRLMEPRPEAYFTLLDFFLAQRETGAALTVWDRLVKLGLPFPMRQSLPLVDELIREDQTSEAQHAWRAALQTSAWPVRTDAGTGLIFNGGFEQEILNGGFDWREAPVSGAQFARETGTAHSGRNSLRVTFDGSANPDFAQVQQYVPAEPSRRYRLSAFLRTEAISTESGMGLEVEDARDPRTLNRFTETLTGSHPWTLVEVKFETGPRTHLLLISLRRKPANKLDNKLSGTVWLDDVSLEPAESGRGAQP